VRNAVKVDVDLDTCLQGIGSRYADPLGGGTGPSIVGNEKQQLAAERGIAVIVGVLPPEFLFRDLADHVIQPDGDVQKLARIRGCA